MRETVFLNGKFLPKEEAKVSVLTPGFLYGFGLFETMRSYNDRIVYFQEHLRRINKSCQLIGMRFPYSPAQLKGIIKKVVTVSGLKDVYVRLTLWKAKRGTGTLIIARKYQPYAPGKYRNGFRACISLFRQNENSLFAHIKTTSYILYGLAYMQAKEKGFDEAIILNNRGYISEGSRSNIFLVKNNTVFSPSLSCGCLDGITRGVIFDLAKEYNIKIYEGNFTLQDLYEADEAFMTNSLMGVMPLVSVNKHQIGKIAKGFKIVRFFIRKYNYLLKNGA